MWLCRISHRRPFWAFLFQVLHHNFTTASTSDPPFPLSTKESWSGEEKRPMQWLRHLSPKGHQNAVARSSRMRIRCGVQSSLTGSYERRIKNYNTTENCAVSRILAKHPLNQASPFESFPLHSTFPHSLRIAHHASEGEPQAARRLKLKSRIRRVRHATEKGSCLGH
jgi:hypothetical protein